MAVGKAVSWMDKSKDGKGEANAASGVYPMDFYAAGSPWATARTKATF